jgi:hypothetical protein
MTPLELRAEIKAILDQLPDNVLAIVLEDLKKIQSSSNDLTIIKSIISENAELLRRLAD